MSHHGGKSFHGNRKRENEPPQKDKVEEDEDEEEEEDPFDSRIQKSGCADLHYALLVSHRKIGIRELLCILTDTQLL